MAGDDQDKQDNKPRDQGALKRPREQPREKLHREDFEKVGTQDEDEAFADPTPPAGAGPSNAAQGALAEMMRAQGAAGAQQQPLTPEQLAAGLTAPAPAAVEPREWTPAGGPDDTEGGGGGIPIESALALELEEAALPIEPRGTAWSALAAAPPEPPDSGDHQ